MGTLQALEAMKEILGIGETLAGQAFDLRRPRDALSHRHGRPRPRLRLVRDGSRKSVGVIWAKRTRLNRHLSRKPHRFRPGFRGHPPMAPSGSPFRGLPSRRAKAAAGRWPRHRGSRGRDHARPHDAGRRPRRGRARGEGNLSALDRRLPEPHRARRRRRRRQEEQEQQGRRRHRTLRPASSRTISIPITRASRCRGSSAEWLARRS